MKRYLILGAMLVCLVAPMTVYAQTNLAWNECGAAGALDNSFACNNNTAVHRLVSSFIAPPGISSLVEAMTDIIVAGNLGPWWSLQSGGCRTALTSEDPAAAGFVGCSAATFAGSPANFALVNYEPNYLGNPHRARINAGVARSDDGVPLTAGVEYQANVVQIRSTKTTGTGACAGCLEPACLTQLRVTLVDRGEAPLDIPASASVSWRGGAIGEPSGCGPTRARRETWGAVKSLHR